eukprot:TRINITY_DN16214_c0_g1_i1.p1 TRINITY_DN16214_c0_g1~~TRINITY_DN16214_c0_g1_i1.p1  ORF type:complete len:191 (+),score=45.73 TRINITY_DN16214_c0_g1_i1:58-573(+)
MGCISGKDEPLPPTLLACVMTGDLSVVNRGLRSKEVSTTIDVCANDGSTPLILAVERQLGSIADALLTPVPAAGRLAPYQPPDGFVNRAKKGGSTALHIAALRGYPDLVDLLLKHGADPTLTTESGKIPRDFTETNSAGVTDPAKREVFLERAERKKRIADRLLQAEQEMA